MKRVISGVLIIAFALLGAYCSAQAIRVNRLLNGRPDIHDSVRDWSTGATACFVAAGVAGTIGNRRASSSTSSRRNPVLIVLVAAVLVVVIIGIVVLLQPPVRPVSPTLAPAPAAPEHPSAP